MHYLKVTIICRYIFLRFWDFVHFTGIKFCYFEYMHDLHNVTLLDSYYYWWICQGYQPATVRKLKYESLIEQCYNSEETDSEAEDMEQAHHESGAGVREDMEQATELDIN